MQYLIMQDDLQNPLSLFWEKETILRESSDSFDKYSISLVSEIKIHDKEYT